MSTTTIGKFTIKYNKSDRQWHALNGRHTAQFPAGDDGKHAAIEHAIKHTHTDLHTAITRMIEKRPFLASRGWKAAQTVIAGHVANSEHWEAVALTGRVKSQSKNFWYQIVKLQGGRLSCNCHDWLDGHAPSGPGGPLCKHIIAYRLYTHLGSTRETVISFRGRAVKQPAPTITDANIYANGHDTPPDMLSNHQSYISSTGRSAHSQEKLISWIYR